MITLDNELATIKVGQNIPIITGSFTTGASGASNPFQTVDRKDVGLLLKVRPQISEGGTIKMSIYHENSGIDNTVSSTSGIVTTVRAIESNVLADDGQIIVLGGLISDDESANEEKVRGLGDIPLIGNLFKYRSRTPPSQPDGLPAPGRGAQQGAEQQHFDGPLRPTCALPASPASLPTTVSCCATSAPGAAALTNGQPPAGGAMATMPPPAPVAARPGQATGPGTNQPQSTAPAQPGVARGRVPSGPAAAGTHTAKLIERS
jgi:general secretion pathway protein D